MHLDSVSLWLTATRPHRGNHRFYGRANHSLPSSSGREEVRKGDGFHALTGNSVPKVALFGFQYELKCKTKKWLSP